MNLLLAILTALITDTARTDLTISGQFGQGTYSIEGTQTGSFSVHAQSVYDFNATSRVFGEASYQWSDSKQTRGVDNADYRLTAPYWTTDTIGGDLRREIYAFYGGYRMLKNHLLWHAALSFRAEQSYRMRDPRAKNKVSDLRIEASIGYQWKRYALSLQAYGGRYKQNNEIRFYSELGETTIFHMANDTAAYARFSGNNKIAYYSGYRAGVGLSLLPTTGWMAGFHYDWIKITKELTTITRQPLFSILDHHRILTSQRTDHFLLTDKEVGTVVVQGIDGREGAFALRNEHVGGNGVVTAQTYLYLAGLVAVTLLLGNQGEGKTLSSLLCPLSSFTRRRWRCEHAVKNLLTSGLTPHVEVGDAAMAPRHRIRQVLKQGVGINGEIAFELVFTSLLRKGTTANG